MPLRSLSMQSRMRNSTTKWTTSRGNSIKVVKNTPNSLDKWVRMRMRIDPSESRWGSSTIKFQLWIWSSTICSIPSTQQLERRIEQREI
jgi:hypothetical protein